MNKRGVQRTALCLLEMCMLALLLSGCVHLSFESEGQIPSAALPTPDVSAMIAPVGDSRESYDMRATLYYRAANDQLASSIQQIQVEAQDNPLRLIVETLLQEPYASSGLLPIAPFGTRLLDIHLAGGVATVDVSAEVLSQGEEAFYFARAAIARTLLSRREVQCVNLLVEGRAAEAAGIPLGASTQQDNSVTSDYARLLTERTLLESEGGFIERRAVLYMPTEQTGPLLPTWITVQLSDENFIPTLLQAFAEKAAALFPQELLLQITADTQIAATGERVLTLYLPEALLSYSPQPRLVPALVNTLCAFVPRIDLVRIYAGQSLLLKVGDSEAASVGGLFSPRQFHALTGSSAQLFYANADAMLVRVTRVLPGAEQTPRALLTALMEAPSSDATADVQPVFPEGAVAEDILGIRIAGGIAHVNISSELYAMCQSLSAERERALVYAIVNTLVYNVDTVQRVQFYIDGAVADTFAGNISIRTPLMANPGLVR